MLTVTPTIGEDGYITLKIKPEVSNVVRELETAQGNSIPIVGTQEAETTVMVKDGMTIIMGGLIQDKQVKTTSKIPIIGSIPLLGIPFRKEYDKIQKGELVIFLTPHIVTGDIDLNTPSKEMMEYLASLEEVEIEAANSEQEPVPEVEDTEPRKRRIGSR